MPYHIVASKQIKPCSCGSGCRAKHGQYETEPEAEAALAELKSGNSTLNLRPIVIPPDPTPETGHGSEELFEELIPLEDSDEEPDVPENSSYLDDDLEVLKGEDTLTSVSESSALITQVDNVVAWHIENLYDENKKRRSRAALMANPPIFRIESSSGDTAEFVLTRKVSETLMDAFTDVNRAYYGVNAKRGTSLDPDGPKDRNRTFGLSSRFHATRTVLLIILVVLVVVTALVA